MGISQSYHIFVRIYTNDSILIISSQSFFTSITVTFFISKHPSLDLSRDAVMSQELNAFSQDMTFNMITIIKSEMLTTSSLSDRQNIRFSLSASANLHLHRLFSFCTNNDLHFDFTTAPTLPGRLLWILVVHFDPAAQACHSIPFSLEEKREMNFS